MDLTRILRPNLSRSEVVAARLVVFDRHWNNFMTRWKPAHVLIEEKTDVRRGDQGFDPEVTAVRVSDGRVSAGIQRDHRAAGVPVDGLAGS